MKTNKNNLKIILIYTLLFSGIIAYFIWIFAKHNKSFIWIGDGAEQNIVILEYFQNLLKSFIRTGHLSTFTWKLGFGFDMFSNLAYYTIGDIFNYISVLFPANKIEMLYNILIIARIYFVGIAFICYCKYKKMQNTPTLIGTLMYTFSSYVLFASVRHPYFINAVTIFPLAMIGIEKAIKEEKYTFYTIIIALTYIINFYFAYMITIIIGIYGITLAIHTHKKEGYKKIIKTLLKTLAYGILGIIISAVILLPTGISFINSERSGIEKIYPYTIKYYRNLINNLLTVNEGQNWVIWGVQSIILITLPVFIKKRKENYPIFITLIILIIPLLISNIGSVLSGFSYPNNRWIFGITFIFSYITTAVLNDSKITKKDIIPIGILFLIYIGSNIIFETKTENYTKIQFIIFLVILILMLSKEKLKKLYDISLTIIIIIGILFGVKYMYDKEGNGYVDEFASKGKIKEIQARSDDAWMSDYGKAVEHIKQKDKSFYKIMKYQYQYRNLSLIMDYNSFGMYWSIIPREYQNLSKEIKNGQYFRTNYGTAEFDYRTRITTLLGAKYYITNFNQRKPYGYKKVEDYNGKSSIYENQYSLPFAVLYTKSILKEEFENLSPIEKEISMLKNTITENENSLTKSTSENIKQLVKEIKYELIDNNKIISENGITVKNTNSGEIKLKIEKTKQSEIYLNIKGLKFKSVPEEEAKIRKQKNKWYQQDYGYTLIEYYKDTYAFMPVEDYKKTIYYINSDEILLCLGYYDEAEGEITINLAGIGDYTYDQIKVYAVSMQEYEQDIQNLKKSNFEITDYGSGYLKGKTNSEENGILQFQTMYNKGFEIYVDGKKVKPIKSNKYFLGIEIQKGEHEIELKYHTPYLKEGLTITLIRNSNTHSNHKMQKKKELVKTQTNSFLFQTLPQQTKPTIINSSSYIN